MSRQTDALGEWWARLLRAHGKVQLWVNVNDHNPEIMESVLGLEEAGLVLLRDERRRCVPWEEITSVMVLSVPTGSEAREYWEQFFAEFPAGVGLELFYGWSLEYGTYRTLLTHAADGICLMTRDYGQTRYYPLDRLWGVGMFRPGESPTEQQSGRLLKLAVNGVVRPRPDLRGGVDPG